MLKLLILSNKTAMYHKTDDMGTPSHSTAITSQLLSFYS